MTGEADLSKWLKLLLISALGWDACQLTALGDEAPAHVRLDVAIGGLTAEGNLPQSSAFCLPKNLAAKLQDKSPEITWSSGPARTKSYALLMVDPDVPADLSLMNKPGVTIPADAPRMNIYHWVLIDIPADFRTLPEGVEGNRFTPGGKPIGPAAYGLRGSNDYWPYFNKNPNAPAAMRGPYGGYDGPCPPSNDVRVHTYKFEVYALDVKTLGLSGQFFATDVLKAMQGHVLAQGEAAAKYILDESLSQKNIGPSGLGAAAEGIDLPK